MKKVSKRWFPVGTVIPAFLMALLAAGVGWPESVTVEGFPGSGTRSGNPYRGESEGSNACHDNTSNLEDCTECCAKKVNKIVDECKGTQCTFCKFNALGLVCLAWNEDETCVKQRCHPVGDYFGTICQDGCKGAFGPKP